MECGHSRAPAWLDVILTSCFMVVILAKLWKLDHCGFLKTWGPLPLPHESSKMTEFSQWEELSVDSVQLVDVSSLPL